MPEFRSADAGESDFFFDSKEEPPEILETVRELVSRRIPKRFGFDPVDEIHRERTGALDSLLVHLSERERDVLTQRFGLAGNPGHTLQEIADLFGLSRERVRQIQAGALARLRELGAERGLFDACGL